MPFLSFLSVNLQVHSSSPTEGALRIAAADSPQGQGSGGWEKQNYLFHYIITQAFPVGIHINSRPEPLLSWGFSSAFQRCKVNLDHFLATPCVHTNLDRSNNSQLASWSEFRTLFQSSGFFRNCTEICLDARCANAHTRTLYCAH